MKLLFFIPVWKRPEITEICFMGINRLRGVGIHQIEALAIISEDSMKPVCEKYGIEWCFYKNFPLGEKKNFGLSQALKKDFDYLIEVGSDDVLKNGFLTLYPWNLDVMGLNDFIILNSEDGNCRRISGRNLLYGTGRAYSRKVVESGDLWVSSKNRGLDNSATNILASRGFMDHRFSSVEPVSIDIKSEDSLNKYLKIGSRYETSKAFDGISEQEKEAIMCLHATTVQ